MLNLKIILGILLIVILIFSAYILFGSTNEDESKNSEDTCLEIECVAKDSNCYYRMGIDENNCTVCGDLICSVLYE